MAYSPRRWFAISKRSFSHFSISSFRQANYFLFNEIQTHEVLIIEFSIWQIICSIIYSIRLFGFFGMLISLGNQRDQINQKDQMNRSVDVLSN